MFGGSSLKIGVGGGGRLPQNIGVCVSMCSVQSLQYAVYRPVNGVHKGEVLADLVSWNKNQLLDVVHRGDVLKDHLKGTLALDFLPLFLFYQIPIAGRLIPALYSLESML
jgi:hypothetical protein